MIMDIVIAVLLVVVALILMGLVCIGVVYLSLAMTTTNMVLCPRCHSVFREPHGVITCPWCGLTDAIIEPGDTHANYPLS